MVEPRTDVDDLIARLRAGERLRATSIGGQLDGPEPSSSRDDGELWFDGARFHLRRTRRLDRPGAAWTPTSVEERVFDEQELRRALAADPHLRTLAGLDG